MEQQTLKVGDKVRTIYGAIKTVIQIAECQVWCASDPKRVTTSETYNHFHPTKVFKIN